MNSDFDKWYSKEHGWKGVTAYKGEQEEICRAAFQAGMDNAAAIMINAAVEQAGAVRELKKRERLAVLHSEINALMKEDEDDEQG